MNVIYGIGYGGLDPPIVALIGDAFGLRRVGVLMGSLIVGWGREQPWGRISPA
ncbi:MAG: hypothetical protein WBC11_05455 [Dehalococcoidia bacterium]